jgi:DNA-binding CsgD family transcriptional regulator
MALFERLKQGFSSDRQSGAKDDIASQNGALECGAAPSVRGKAGIAETEKCDRVAQLTPREYDLYLLLLEGYTLNESAKQLSVKYSTANTHMSAIYRKLGVSSRAELIINYHTVTVRTV